MLHLKVILVDAATADVGPAGALLSYGPSIVDMFNREGEDVRKILKGAK